MESLQINEIKLLAFLDGTLPERQMAEIVRWYDASPENRALLEQLFLTEYLYRCCITASELDAQQALSELKAQIALRAKEAAQQRRRGIIRAAMRYAAVAVILFAVVFTGIYIYNDRNDYCEVVADNSQFRTISLPDHSTVTLKADSKISFHTKFMENRVVYLDGEAMFDVAKVDGSEFIVKAKSAQIIVKGTKFNFKAHNNNPQIEATLIEGAVDFRTSGHKVAIKPNQKLLYNSDTRRMSIVEVDAQLDVFGERYFEGERLGYIVNSLEHIYNCKISFSDNRLEEIRFTGTINRDNSLGHTLNIVTLTTGTSFQRYGDAVVIGRR